MKKEACFFVFASLLGCGGSQVCDSQISAENHEAAQTRMPDRDSVPLSEELTAPQTLRVSSPDFDNHGTLANTFVFSGFGCTGENLSPALSWEGAPEGTQSYAIVVHDPDAPTGVGFFHWLAYDIPASTPSLTRGAATSMPQGSKAGHTDFGTQTYGGPCPPPGTPHRYVFTVYALRVPSLGIDAGASGALLRFMLRENTLAYGRIIGTYGR